MRVSEECGGALLCHGNGVGSVCILCDASVGLRVSVCRREAQHSPGGWELGEWRDGGDFVLGNYGVVGSLCVDDYRECVCHEQRRGVERGLLGAAELMHCKVVERSHSNGIASKGFHGEK
jgi:hypothetical protein